MLPSASLRRERFQRDYVFVACAFAVLMVLTNMIGTKLFLFFPEWLPSGFGSLSGYGYVVLTTGLITYPLTFLLTDVCAEVYGRRRANYMVSLGFVMSLLMLLVVHIAGWLPRADRYWADAAAQPVQGTQVLAVEAGGLRLDDASHLLLPPEQVGLAAVVVDTTAGPRPEFFRHRGLQPPVQTMAGDPAPSQRPLRWDNRGLLLAEAAPAAAQHGSWVVPAVEILALEGHHLVLAPAVNLPPSGRLLSASGRSLSYSSRGVDGRVALAELPTDLQPGMFLAVWNQYTPAELQKNLVSIFSAPGILLMASMLAYLVAQYLDVWLYHFWRRLTRGRYLWLRNNGSTAISQLVDTIIVNSIFLHFAFGMSREQIFDVIVCVYLVKLGLALLDTPLIYAATWWAKRRLGYRLYEEMDPELLGLPLTGAKPPA